MQSQTLITVADVERSCRWYCEALGLESADGGDEYEQLTFAGRLLLQLHRWDVHDHEHLGAPDLPVGNGVVLWFESAGFDEAVLRARSAAVDVLEDVHVNELAGHREMMLRDPDGYHVVISSPYGDMG